MKKRRTNTAISVMPIFLMIALGFAFINVQNVDAKGVYMNNFGSTYSAIVGTQIDSCGVCHYDFGGGGARNWYGQDFENNNYDFVAIEELDSDVDGYSNSEETETFFMPGLTCDDLGSTVNAPFDLADYVNPDDIGCTTCIDNDGDEYGSGLPCLDQDCNDNDPAVNPGASEVCDDIDEIDEDCDGLANSADPECVGFDCSSYTSRQSCNNDPNCKWNNKQSLCEILDTCTVTENPEISCTDSLDNDCDNLVDSADPDCGSPDCSQNSAKRDCNKVVGCTWSGGICITECTVTEDPEVSCIDSQDNDCDGLTDNLDYDCFGGLTCDAAGCHQGIENVAPSMNFQCTTCHYGNGDASSKEVAHTGMYANPSDLRVIDQTCSGCHPKTENVKKSLHATMAGMISGTRYDFGVQDRTSYFATYDVVDNDGDVPYEKGAVDSLTKIPQYDPGMSDSFDNSPGDDYLRNQCLRCHLWSGGHERTADYRASGCAACHMIYDDDGRYKGGDQAILDCQDDSACMDRIGRKAFPRAHQLTPKIPVFQCLHCHNRGGRTGVSFIGTMESDAYGSPWTETGSKQPKLHGKNYNHLTADIHYERGMACIDCHTQQDIMGDGNIYQKKEHAVEIECTDCHGTITTESNLTTSWGNPFPNLRREGTTAILTSKLDGTDHIVPQIATMPLSQYGEAAMRGIGVHTQKLECYACHASWAPQCYGCHAKQDLRVTGRDWVDPEPHPNDPSKTAKKSQADASQIAFGWEESRSYLRWETPNIGINATSEGNLVAPYIPGCQVFFTQIGTDGNAIVSNYVYTTVDGTKGISQEPIQTHTNSNKPRTCESCHNSRKALGLGTGIYDPIANLLGINFELEQTVDENGIQIQGTAHEGARPFNAIEQEALQMDTTCYICHINGIP